MQYTWKTSAGAEVKADITVERFGGKTTYPDGSEAHFYRWARAISDMTVNGQPIENPTFTKVNGADAICVGRVEQTMAFVLIPDEIAEELVGEERRANQN